MASTDGSKKTDPAEGADVTVRRARTAAEQRQARSNSSDDPEVLADEIERTREELAETLDAIADKVSPKRVAARTKKQVSEAVKGGAAEASATVKEKAAEAGAAVSSGAASLRSTAEHVKEAVQEKVSGSTSSTPAAATTTGALADASDLGGPATTSALDPAGADIPPLPAVGTATSGGGVATYGASPGVSKELLAGAAAAIAVLLLVLRRRRRR